MVIADFSGNFTNPDNCAEGDIGVVTSEGEYETKQSFKGQDYRQLSIDVQINGKTLIHSIGINEGKALVKAWGSDTKDWIGKKFTCHVVRYMSQGQTKSKVEIEAID